MKKVISGHLSDFFETGCEGILWFLMEDGKEHYESLNSLENGDYLKIFKNKNVVWEGIICREYLKYNNWTQKNIDYKDWSKMFYNKFRAELIKK